MFLMRFCLYSLDTSVLDALLQNDLLLGGPACELSLHLGFARKWLCDASIIQNLFWCELFSTEGLIRMYAHYVFRGPHGLE